MLIASILLALAVTSPALAADVQDLRYTLSIDGQVVGVREVQLKYLQDELGRELRVIESWTQADLVVAGQPLRFQQRLTGLSDGGGFASRMVEAGRPREVQAAPTPGGWVVTVHEGDQARVYQHGHGSLDLTSLGLLDPSAPERLAGQTELSVLSAELGEIHTGPLSDRGEVIVPVGGRSLTAREYLWTLPEGQVRLAYDPSGVLLRYTMNVAGRSVTATLDAPPEGRSWGSAMQAPLIPGGGAPEVEETEL